MKKWKIIPKLQSKVYTSEIINALLRKNRKSMLSFEEEFSKITGINYCISTFTGRAALIASLFALDLQKGDEVLMPGFTFVGLPKIVSSLGYLPVFIDIDESSLNINPDKIESMISKKSKALLIVHNLGNPCDMDKILKICKKHNLFLIEDCAHTIGSKYKGNKLGSFGDISIFSFHYSKIINTYWGGMACTNNKIFAEKIKSKTQEFKEQTALQILKRMFVSSVQSIISLPFIYSFVFFPINKLFKSITKKDIIDILYQLKPQDIQTHMYKFSNFQAEIGLQQLKKLDSYNSKRILLRDLFIKNINNSVKTQKNLENCKFVPLQLTAIVKNKKKVVAYLLKNKIEANPFYIPDLSRIKEFKRCRNNCTVSREIPDKIIFFPTFHYLNENEIIYLSKKINESLK